MTVMNVRMNLVGLAIAIALAVGISGEATAKRRSPAALDAHGQIGTAGPGPARPAMRYYGGPKSPMWVIR